MSLSPSRDDREPTEPDLSVNPIFIKEPTEIPRDRLPSTERARRALSRCLDERHSVEEEG
jgi:hypothetical protein